MIKVSVILPVYKVEAYLPACLDSVLGQSLREIEAICIDDASPDNCPQILEEYARRDERVRVIHLPENHQQGYGRNRGLETARGQYAYFLDSDDMITPDALEKLYALAERDGLDGIFFDSQVRYESEELARKNSNYQAVRRGAYEDKVYSGQTLFEAFIDQQEWSCYVQRQFWNREFLLDHEVWFPEGTEHEDEFFPFKAILLAQRVRYLPERFFIRRYREASVMTRPAHPKDFHGYFVNYCKMVDLVEDEGLYCPGAALNIAHMYERAVQFYPLFASRENPKDWFAEAGELQRFQMFAHAQDGPLYYRHRVKNLLTELPPGARIWIYGAGAIGKIVYRGLESAGLAIDGFLVTNRRGNPDTLFGHRVCELESVPASADAVAVIAIAQHYQPEICTALERRGWRYITFAVGR